MNTIKTKFNTQMTKTIKIAITATLVLVVTVNLVTQQVLAVSLENSESTSITKNTQIVNDQTQFIVNTDNAISKLNQSTEKTKESLTSNVLQSAIAERENILKSILEDRINNLKTISLEDKSYLQNEVSQLKTDLEKIRGGLKLNDKQSNDETKLKLFKDLQFYKISGPRIHFEIELAKLKYFSNKFKDVIVKFKKDPNFKPDNANTSQLEIQSQAIDANISLAKEKIDQLDTNNSNLDLNTLKSDIRVYLGKAKDQLQIAKNTFDEIYQKSK